MFDAVQTMSGAGRMLRVLLSDHIRARPGMSVLDLGCGTARVSHFLEGCLYIGIDSNPAYVDYASRMLRTGSRLVSGDFSDARRLPERNFDVVLAIGLLHHLSDRESSTLLEIAAEKLARHGRLVTIDPCIERFQNPFVRALMRMDRGRYVRTRQGYEAIAQPTFSDVRSFVRYDTLFYPYAHCILELSGSLKTLDERAAG
jgi:cyclopropane fatty-acyl-phospholipid synthase-like methyltransferase